MKLNNILRQEMATPVSEKLTAENYKYILYIQYKSIIFTS